MYVLGKDSGRNALIVGTLEELGQSELLAFNINWASGTAPSAPFRAQVKIRYTAREAPAEVTPLENGSKARVRFDEPQRDITPGQAAVFYDGDIVTGGGVIVSSR